MLTRQQARKICDRILDYSTAKRTEVTLSDADSSLTRFGKNTIIQNVNSRDVNLSVRVVIGKSAGCASTNYLGESSLRATVERAVKQAGAVRPERNIAPLAGPGKYRRVNNFVGRTAALTPEERAEAIRYIAAKCRRAGIECAGAYSSGTHVLALANSKGMFAYDKSTKAEFGVTVLAKNSAGWAEGASRDCAKIDAAKLSDIAFEKAVRGKNPKAVPAGKYTVVLEPAAVTDFLMFMGRGFSGQAVQDGTSFLAGRIGKKLFGDNITIVDDAYHPDNSGLPFDFEGTPRRRVVLVENGVVKNLLYDLKSAKNAGTKSTGHGLPQPNPYGGLPLNMVVEAGDSSLEEMIRSTKKGLLVTHFHYCNVAERRELVLTGMTRDGVFLIENGKIKHPVKNMRFTESVIKAFSNVEMISRKRIYASAFFGGGFVVPAMKINKFNFSSETKF